MKHHNATKNKFDIFFPKRKAKRSKIQPKDGQIQIWIKMAVQQNPGVEIDGQ
jgi:hypothetical protein